MPKGPATNSKLGQLLHACDRTPAIPRVIQLLAFGPVGTSGRVAIF